MNFKGRVACVVALSVGVILVAASSAWAVSPVHAGKKVADKFLKKHLEAYDQKDLKALMALYAPGAVVVGPPRAARWIGKARIRAGFKAIFAREGRTRAAVRWLRAGRRGRVVWFSCELLASSLHGKKWLTVRLLWSGVLVKGKRGWLLIQTHLSLAPPVKRAK